MAMFGIQFDATEGEASTPREGFTLIPPDKYPAQIVESTRREEDPEDPNVTFNLKFEIVEGEYMGRNLWADIRFFNEREDLQLFGRANMTAICRSIDVLKATKTEDLHFKTLLIHVGTKLAGYKEKNGFVHQKDKNVINGYSKAPAGVGLNYQPKPRRQPFVAGGTSSGGGGYQPQQRPVSQPQPAMAGAGAGGAPTGGGSGMRPWEYGKK